MLGVWGKEFWSVLVGIAPGQPEPAQHYSLDPRLGVPGGGLHLSKILLNLLLFDHLTSGNVRILKLVLNSS